MKAYWMEGNDELKLMTLKFLSESDYLTCHRFEFAKNTSIVFEDQTIKGYVPRPMLHSYFDTNNNLFFSELERQLPPILGMNKFRQFIADKQKFPKQPLGARTFLMENDRLELRPYSTEENKEWYRREKERLKNI